MPVAVAIPLLPDPGHGQCRVLHHSYKWKYGAAAAAAVRVVSMMGRVVMAAAAGVMPLKNV